MKSKKIIITIIMIVIISLILLTTYIINYKDEGYFKNENYIINNSNIKITQTDNNEVQIYSAKLELTVPNLATKIGWNKEYIIIEHENIYTIIDIKEEKIINEIDKKEYEKMKKNSKMKHIKLKTIGRYLSKTYN